MLEKDYASPANPCICWVFGFIPIIAYGDENSGTSLSIDNQKSIILNFIEDDPLQFMLADTYIDDGISGATAEKRHEFQRLIEDVKAGIINCVITNDTSRFARNVADAEYYVNTVFPIHDTRFIALGSPRIDSYEDPESVDGMLFHFENYFNEYYVKMTSKKIRKVFDMKTKRGEFIGSYAPYGYAKDPDNKNKLVVDEEAAEIVKRIFSMFVYDKLSLRAVAMRLNDMGVLPPREYKITKGITPNSRPAKIPSWHYNTVKIILSDEKYCGHMVQGKLKNISYKVKKAKRQDPEDWVIVRNTHEPIIDEELFQKAQVLLVRPSRATTSGNGEKSLYSSFLYCEKCGFVMSRERNKDGGRYSELPPCQPNCEKYTCVLRHKAFAL
jgi:DNA invertase Pin-like site-specific DNA recombinase